MVVAVLLVIVSSAPVSSFHCHDDLLDMFLVCDTFITILNSSEQ